MPEDNSHSIDQLMQKLKESIGQNDSLHEAGKKEIAKSVLTVAALKRGFSGISSASFYSQSPAGRIRMEVQLLDGRRIAFCFANQDAAEKGHYQKVEYRAKGGRMLHETLTAE